MKQGRWPAMPVLNITGPFMLIPFYSPHIPTQLSPDSAAHLQTQNNSQWPINLSSSTSEAPGRDPRGQRNST